MVQLFEIDVKLSPNQKKNLSKAYHNKQSITLRLSSNSLSGNDRLLVPKTVMNRLQKSKQMKKGMDIKLSKTNIRNQIGGSLLTSILAMGKSLLPTIGKTLGLSALAGLASEGASQVVKSISGSGFLIPQNKIDQLIKYKHLLSEKQKKDILDALQSGQGVYIIPTETQHGGAIGTILASIGIPLAIDFVKNLFSGGSAPRLGPPPPFIGNWSNGRTYGRGEKTKKQNSIQ